MRGTQEQFDRIKPKLSINFIGMEGAFFDYAYLTNFYNSELGLIGFTSKLLKSDKSKIYETWNERIFLKACGIKCDDVFEITKEQILELDHLTNSISGKDIREKLRDLYPSVFEVELTVGKWYKGDIDFKSLIYITGLESKQNILKNGLAYTKIEYYGFVSGKYHYKETICNIYHEKSLVEATTEEVKEALIAEAKKRYKKGDCVECLYDGRKPILSGEKVFSHTGIYHVDEFYQTWINVSKSHNSMIFNKGKWAERVNTITKAEAERQLNAKII
jgi:hypothetical protein